MTSYHGMRTQQNINYYVLLLYNIKKFNHGKKFQFFRSLVNQTKLNFSFPRRNIPDLLDHIALTKFITCILYLLIYGRNPI